MMVKMFVTLFNEVKFGSLNSSKPLAPKADWRDLKTAQEMSLTLTVERISDLSTTTKSSINHSQPLSTFTVKN